MTTSSASLCRILDRNLALEGTLSGAGWATDLDEMLAPTLIEDTAVWTGAGVAAFDLVLPRRDPVSALHLTAPPAGLGQPTLRRDALVRITYAADTAVTVLAPGAPAPAWRRVFPRAWRRDSLPWSAANWWTGAPTERDLAGYPRAIIDLPPRLRPRAIRVEIDNRGDPFALSHLFAAAAFVPSWGIDWGRELVPEFRSRVDKTPGGGRIVFQARPQRVQTVVFEDLDEDEAARFQDLSMRLDQHVPLLVIPNPRGVRHLWREVFVGFLRAAVARRHQQGDLWRAQLTVEEMIG